MSKSAIASIFLLIMFILGLVLIALGQVWGVVLFLIGYIGGKILRAARD